MSVMCGTGLISSLGVGHPIDRRGYSTAEVRSDEIHVWSCMVWRPVHRQHPGDRGLGGGERKLNMT